MAIKKYLSRKALKLGKRIFSKKARSTAQKRALAKAVKISAMKRSKNKVAKTAVFSGFFKPNKVVTKTTFKIGKAVKIKGAKFDSGSIKQISKVSKVAAAKYAKSSGAKKVVATTVKNLDYDDAMGIEDKVRLGLLGIYGTAVATLYVGDKLQNSRFRKNLRDYRKSIISERNEATDRRRMKTAPPQLSPELELNAQRQKIQRETEKYLRDMRRKLELEKKRAKQQIIQNRKTGTV